MQGLGAPLSRKEWGWLAFILGLALVLGALLVPGLGQSTDEYADFEYAANSLRTYAGSPYVIGPSFHDLYGPVHLELGYVVGEAARRLPLGWRATDGRHLANYASFLMAVGALYVLCRRRLGLLASIATIGLFATQPLLFGQAFINQKDTPFMAYFTLAVAIGILSVDRLSWGVKRREDMSTHGESGIRLGASGDLGSGLPRWGRIVSGSLVGVAALLGLASLFNLLFLPLIKHLLAQAYAGSAWGPIQALFDRIATDAYKTPLSLYEGKLEMVNAWLKIPFSTIWFGVGLWIARRRFHPTWNAAASRLPKGMWLMSTAGVVLGLADSIRVGAPLAGLLVAGFLLAKHGRRAWIPLFLYTSAALCATYLTWPWLWASPVARYLQAIQVMSHFPSHKVLFAGVVYASSTIPWDYVPRLVALQTTEVVVPLFLVGFVIGANRVVRREPGWLEALLMAVWLVGPVLLVIVLQSSLYGNLRQMLFILPPMFYFCALAIESGLARLRSRVWRVGALAALVMPGLVGMAVLHPYEDSYYNAWVGWTSGAYGRYQIDPWCTSYREAIAYVNTHAPQGAAVDVRGPFISAADFARPDLKMHPDFQPVPNPDYALLCQVDVLGDGFQGDLPIVYRVTRGRAVLAVVRGTQ